MTQSGSKSAFFFCFLNPDTCHGVDSQRVCSQIVRQNKKLFLFADLGSPEGLRCCEKLFRHAFRAGAFAQWEELFRGAVEHPATEG